MIKIKNRLKNNRKALLVTTMLLTVVFSVVLYTKSSNNKNMSYEEVKDNRAMAFYIEKDGSYEPTSIMPTRGYKLNEEKSVCSNGAKVSLNMSDYSLNISNLNGHTNCYLYFDEIFGSAAKTVLGDITNIEEKTEFTGIATSADTGIYSAPDDYGTSYYFRGLEGSLNNWIKFADSYWRIIRVNGNGTIRMIYSGAANGNVSSSNKTGDTTQIGTSSYNHTYNDNAYVGYMMGIPLNGTTQTANETSSHSTSYTQAHTNTYDSDAKIQVDNWYKTNIEDKGLSKYIDVNTGFCNDRQIDKTAYSSFQGDGYGTQYSGYSPWGRAYKNDNWATTQTPTLQCSNKTRDLFTVNNTNTENKGNKKLTYPVGLITSDEVVFAGGFGGANNSTYYLYTNQHYWTMSPYNFYNGNADGFTLDSTGGLNWNGMYSTNGLRPIINLRADTVFSGEGSESNPYKIEN